MSPITVLSPVPDRSVVTVSLAPRHTSPRRIAFVGNLKINADRLLSNLAELLREDENTHAEYVTKPSASEPIPAAQLAAIRGQYDAAVTGIAD